MASQSQRNTSRIKPRQSRGGNIWIWIGLILIAALVIAWLVYRSQDQGSFSIVSGEKEILVLLRNERNGTYRLRYDGREPVELKSIQVMLEGQTLHVDVKPLVLEFEGQEYQVQSDGSLPPGTVLRLEPGQEFDTKVTYLGQTLGGNYLFGFRIVYSQAGRQRTQELALDHEYEVIVE